MQMDLEEDGHMWEEPISSTWVQSTEQAQRDARGPAGTIPEAKLWPTKRDNQMGKKR